VRDGVGVVRHSSDRALEQAASLLGAAGVAAALEQRAKTAQQVRVVRPRAQRPSVRAFRRRVVEVLQGEV
jgi:hypothetical protein